MTSRRKPSAYVNPENAGSSRYKKITEEIAGQKVCPFCPKHFKWHTKPILKKSGAWLLTENFQPYKNARYHFLLIGAAHKEQLSKLSAKDWTSITALLRWVIKKHAIAGGGIAMRFGNTTHTGATVSHLHMHLIVPTVKRGKAEPVWFPFG